MNMKPTLWASAAAAIGASLCCVAPLVLASLGLGSAWMSALPSMNPSIILTAVLDAFSSRLLAAQKTVTFGVPGMTCGVCPITVKKAISRGDGVTQTAADFDKHQAVVTYDDAKAKAKASASADQSCVPRPMPATRQRSRGRPVMGFIADSIITCPLCGT